MGSARKIARRSLLLVTVAGVCGVCLWLPLVTFNDLPPWEAMEVARRHARDAGHDVVGGGGSGEYVTQPDALGGCEVEVQLGFRPEGDRRTVAVRLRRSSALSSWQVVGTAVHEPPR